MPSANSKADTNTGKAPGPLDTTSRLGRAYCTFRDKATQRLRADLLPWVVTEDLDAVEALATLRPATLIGALYRQMIQDLATEGALVEASASAAFRDRYDQAVALALPATTAYLRHAQIINQMAHSHSLSQVRLKTLKQIDREGHTDEVFGQLVKDLVAKLGPKTQVFDVVAYSQFFEVYGEAITLRHLRARPGLDARRVEESKVPGEGRPDFVCSLKGGQPFYIEVKSLDVVGGEFRQREMMEDGLERMVELETRGKAGRPVAMVEGSIAPYRNVGAVNGYDPRSLKLVIDTLHAKCRTAFKQSQFGLGPTFALVLIDRLILPGQRHALAPYYYEPPPASCCLTGALWHLAYGQIGAPIFRAPDFTGGPTLEAVLTSDGLYTDKHQLFPGKGLIVLDGHGGDPVAYGLGNPSAGPEPWTIDDTEEALEAICDAQNDACNSFGYLLSDARST